MKLSKSVKSLLFEAYRRNMMEGSFEENKPIQRRWLGLGTEDAYRPAIDAVLMVFHDGRTPPPRCMGWLVMTEKGVKALQEHEDEFKVVLDEIKERGYEKTYLSQYMLAGGLTTK